MKEELKSKYEGVIVFDNIVIEVAILNDNSRVLYERTLGGMRKHFKDLKYLNKKGDLKTAYTIDEFIKKYKTYTSHTKYFTLASKIVFVFEHFEATKLINEVTGYNMSKKIEKKLIKDYKKKDIKLSEFDKKIKQALNFNPKENK